MNIIYMEQGCELKAYVSFVGHKYMYCLGTKDEVESLLIEQLENLIIEVVLRAPVTDETIH